MSTQLFLAPEYEPQKPESVDLGSGTPPADIKMQCRHPLSLGSHSDLSPHTNWSGSSQDPGTQQDPPCYGGGSEPKSCYDWAPSPVFCTMDTGPAADPSQEVCLVQHGHISTVARPGFSNHKPGLQRSVDTQVQAWKHRVRWHSEWLSTAVNL